MDTHTSSPGSMGKLRFHLVGRLKKRVNSKGSILVLSITTRYPEFQITCYATYSASWPRFLTNYITEESTQRDTVAQVWLARHNLSMVEYKALIGLSLLWLPQFHARPRASLKDLNPDTTSMRKAKCFPISR
jgi:hypothetical protein